MAHHVLLLLLSLAAAAAVAAAAADAEDPLIRQAVPGGDDNDLELNAESHFLSFVQRFGKSYKDADEHAYRLSVFKSNLRRARRHQLLDPSAEHGITKFSDLTPAEFRRTYLGLRKSRRALLRELGGSAHEAPVLPTDGLPEDFDWRDHGAVGPVKNQGAHYLATGKLEVLSEQQFVDCDHEGRGVKANKLNALPLETVSSLKEPVGIVFSDELGGLSKESTESEGQELPSRKAGEHKSCVLSEVTAAADGIEVLEQVPRREAQDGGLVSTDSEEQEKTTGSQQQSSSEEILLETMPKQTSDKFVAENSLTARTDGKTKSFVLPDTRIRNIKDQLIKAKVYLGLGSIRANSQYLKDLRQRIREVQKVLGDASKDTDLPKNANEKVKALEQMLIKGRQMQDDCSIVVKKLRAMLHSAEEQLHAHKKQTVFLTQLAAKTLPKGLHCLPLRLANEYFSLDPDRQQFPNQHKLTNPKLYHYALFSDNILATAVVVNSTVLNAKHPSDHVFHIVTDRLNYAPMRMWFLSNPPGKATIEVQNIGEFTWLNDSYSPVLKQLGSQSMIDYYFGTNRANPDSNLKYRNPKYLSILNHLRFYLPEIYPKLDKMVFLDDDIVVKKDLTGLWSINMKGKVNGAVETCGESFHRFDRYLNFSNHVIAKNFDPHACGWAFGMNVFDLAEWKRQNITQIYHSWQKLNQDRSLWKLGTLPPGLITFWNKTFPLSRSWHVLGLGYNPHVNSRDIERAAVIHYNGNMKPWLEIGLPKFRSYWSKYLDYDQPFLRECNINP